MLNKIITLGKQLYGDSLYRNSLYLMASTVVMAGFGFFFWIINARLFTSEQVGIATTLLSVMTLISNFSLLGLNNSLIKYLPTSDRKNDKINTSFSLVGLTSIAVATIYLNFIGIFSPKLIFVKENIMFSLFFILFVVFSTLNTITENVFIAYRSAIYVLVKNFIWSVVKLLLPLILITLGAYGIFMSVGFASVVTFMLCLLIMVWKFNYILKPYIHIHALKRMFRFSMGNYLAGYIGGLPSIVLPILITNTIGAKYSAYYYMDMMIANLLYIIPIAVSQSLFAEGSYSESDLQIHLKKASKIIFIILIPCITLLILAGKYILLVFGKQYSSEGITFLQLLILSSVFISVNSICNSILIIKKRINLLILVNIIGATAILCLSFVFIKLNLYGIGIGWFIGNSLITAIYMYIVRKYL